MRGGGVGGWVAGCVGGWVGVCVQRDSWGLFGTR